MLQGYRELNPAEIALANKWQEEGERLRALYDETKELISNRTAIYGTPDGEHHRWLSIARTHYQQAIQAAKTAVTAPNFDW